MATRDITCQYCGETRTLRGKADDINAYLTCCNTCWENDEPGMARFNRMAERMSPEWALHNYEPQP